MSPMRNKIILSIFSYISFLLGLYNFSQDWVSPFHPATTVYYWNSRISFILLYRNRTNRNKVSLPIILHLPLSPSGMLIHIPRVHYVDKHLFHSSNTLGWSYSEQILSHSKTGYTYWGSDNFLIHISLTRHRKRYVLTVLSCHSFTINVIRNLTFGYRKVYLLPLYGLWLPPTSLGYLWGCRALFEHPDIQTSP